MRPAVYQQETELSLIEMMLPFLERKTFIDVGAEKGGFADFMVRHGFSGAMFEPCPKHHPVLKAISDKRSISFYPIAIDCEDREADLFISVDEQNAPLDYYHSLQKLDNDHKVHHKQSVRVTCRRLDTLVAQGIVPTDPGILKTDTEGNDLRVLKGMGKMRPEVIMCEFLTPGLYAGWQEAFPGGIVGQAANLGYGRYIAVKRYKGRELVSFSPSAFLDGQWGNLIFMTETVYRQSRDALLHAVAACERALFVSVEEAIRRKDDEIEKLQAACKERLELIEYLHGEAARRLDVIDQLQMALKTSGEKEG